MPRLSAFQQAHHGIDVRVTTSTALVDFRDGDVDAAIRYGRGQWPGLRADWLTADGRALLHFSRRGDLDGLHRIAAETGLHLRPLAKFDVLDRGDVVQHQLVEIRADGTP
jgi:DNA-binding transcriptional LysR family regulator